MSYAHMHVKYMHVYILFGHINTCYIHMSNTRIQIHLQVSCQYIHTHIYTNKHTHNTCMLHFAHVAHTHTHTHTHTQGSRHRSHRRFRLFLGVLANTIAPHFPHHRCTAICVTQYVVAHSLDNRCIYTGTRDVHPITENKSSRLEHIECTEDTGIPIGARLFQIMKPKFDIIIFACGFPGSDQFAGKVIASLEHQFLQHMVSV